MRTKGTTVKAIQNFVKDVYSDKYSEWIESLPEASREIMTKAIYATDWYPLNAGIIEPTYHLKMFYSGNSLKAAWESGRHSASSTLTGVYKVFIKMTNPFFAISRAFRITGTYYENVEVNSEKISNTSAVITIDRFPELHKLIEHRIGGWVECALELCGCKDITSRITKSITKGDDQTRYEFKWK